MRRRGAARRQCRQQRLRSSWALGWAGGRHGCQLPPLPTAIWGHQRQCQSLRGKHRAAGAQEEPGKKVRGTLPSEKSFWMSVPRVPSPWHSLAGFRRKESPHGWRRRGCRREDSQQRREVAFVSNPSSKKEGDPQSLLNKYINMNKKPGAGAQGCPRVGSSLLKSLFYLFPHQNTLSSCPPHACPCG